MRFSDTNECRDSESFDLPTIFKAKWRQVDTAVILFTFQGEKNMRFQYFKELVILLGLSVVLVDMASGGDIFSQRQRTRTKGRLPPHNYNHDAWPYTTPRTFRATAIAVANPGPPMSDAKFKPFHFHATALTVDHLTLDQVGIALDKTDGWLVASGRITHNGGDGGLIGSNVTVRIRGYATHQSAITPTLVVAAETAVERDEIELVVPNDVTRIPPDAYVLWSSEHSFWVSRGGPRTVSLTPSTGYLSSRSLVTEYFDNTTHIEVELEYRLDR